MERQIIGISFVIAFIILFLYKDTSITNAIQGGVTLLSLSYRHLSGIYKPDKRHFISKL